MAHRIYGVPQTNNTVNYVYFLAYEELAALRPRIRGDGSDCGEQGFGFGDYRGVAVASSGTGSRNTLATLRGVPVHCHGEQQLSAASQVRGRTR